MKRFLSWLVALQVRRPIIPLAVAALATLFFASRASQLTLRTQYEAMLPDDAPSVIELGRLQKRTNASQTLLVLLEGPDRAALRRMGDDVATELRALGPALVTSALDGTRDARAFLAPRSALFLPTADLERIARQVDERWDYEVAKADGSLLDDDAPAPPLPTADDLRRSSADKSAPAQNDSSPAPLSTATKSWSSSRNRIHASCNNRAVSPSTQLRFSGRFSVMKKT